MPVTKVSTKWVSGNLYFYDVSGNVIGYWDGTNRKFVPYNSGLVFSIRTRFTIAQVNAGATVLAAITGLKYRMVSCKAIAVGGAATAVTTVDVLGTQTSSVKLVAFAQASLAQSAVLTAGGTGAAVLADGASFAPCDAGAAITIGKTGSSVATATHIDLILDYAIEA